jgi:hypothetical protein
MRFSATVLGVVAATSLALAPVNVQAGPGSKAQKPVKTTTSVRPAASAKPTTSPKASSKPTLQSAPKSGPKATKPSKVTTTTTTTRTTGKPTSTGKSAKAPSTTTTTTTTTTTKAAKHGGTTTTTTPTSDTTTLNPIAAKIASKPNLNAKLTAMLPIDPMTGKTMTLDKASLGFKNQGQFIAALHVSENLGIPFTQLKSNMVTVTPGAPGEPPTATQTGSLGQAIQKSKAMADVPVEVQRAELQASADLQAPVTTTTTTAGTTRKTTPKGGVR